MGEFEVDVEGLRDHARRVGVVADSVGVALDAAHQVRMGGEAFGVMCAFLPPVLNVLEGAVAAAVDAVGRSLERTAGEVVAMAREYEDSDDSAAQLLGGVGRTRGSAVRGGGW